MRVPQNVARRLREVLGADAAEDLVTWMDETTSVRADVAELRQELHDGLVRVETGLSAQVERTRAELQTQMERMRAEFQVQIERTRTELQTQIERSRADLFTHIEHNRSELLKWSFVFWCGAVAAVAALAGVLRG